jgi:hypothetical protein
MVWLRGRGCHGRLRLSFKSCKIKDGLLIKAFLDSVVYCQVLTDAVTADWKSNGATYIMSYFYKTTVVFHFRKKKFLDPESSKILFQSSLLGCAKHRRPAIDRRGETMLSRQCERFSRRQSTTDRPYVDTPLRAFFFHHPSSLHPILRLGELCPWYVSPLNLVYRIRSMKQCRKKIPGTEKKKTKGDDKEIRKGKESLRYPPGR